MKHKRKAFKNYVRTFELADDFENALHLRCGFSKGLCFSVDRFFLLCPGRNA